MLDGGRLRPSSRFAARNPGNGRRRTVGQRWGQLVNWTNTNIGLGFIIIPSDRIRSIADILRWHILEFTTTSIDTTAVTTKLFKSSLRRLWASGNRAGGQARCQQWRHRAHRMGLRTRLVLSRLVFRLSLSNG
jgi:hypothetical protein